MKDALGHGSNNHDGGFKTARAMANAQGRAMKEEMLRTQALAGNKAAADELASGSKSAPAPAHDGTIGRHGYNPEAVSKAIANNRTGKIGAREASAIHRLLRGLG